LAVDDEPIIIMMLDDLLAPHYRMLLATTGEEALRLAVAEAPDLVLLDIGLPDLDGYEVCRRLRGSEATRDLPVIFLSSHDLRSEIVRGFEAGGMDYVRKPFEVTELLARIETHLRLHQQKLALEDALAQNRLLLNELNHRVKNNLTVVCSLLSLQSHRAGNEQVVHHLTEAQNRIKVMAGIHETLYRSNKLASIDTRQFFTGIASQLVGASGRVNIRLHTECDAVDLALDAAAPCGLIINELVTNALKHAFPGGRPGIITLTLKHEPPDLVLTIGDDGVGLPEGLDPARTRSLGFTIVTGLAKQIDGWLSVTSGPKATFVIRFPSKNQTVPRKS
jgi:two-component sensor histidine kinase